MDSRVELNPLYATYAGFDRVVVHVTHRLMKLQEKQGFNSIMRNVIFKRKKYEGMGKS